MTAAELTKMVYADNTQALLDATDKLCRKGSVESLKVLFECLQDDYDYDHEMSAILHAAERAEPRVFYATLRASLSELDYRAPDWSRRVVKRCLSSPIHADPGCHSIEVFLEEVVKESSCTEVVVRIACELLRERKISKVVGAIVKRTLET